MATATHVVASRSSPTASPFAKLLRRSRFAAFDPNIRQTYSAPKAHAHRGDFGLKRPLTIRRKNAFITLTAPFDAREQYVEWVKGESQVRFIRRYEEMDTNASVPHASAWYKNQSSKTATDWLIDSEFGDEMERPEKRESMSIDDLVKEKLKEPVAPIMSDLSGVSAKMADVEKARHAIAVTTSGLSPNIEAMSEAEFEKFVERTRKLRPQFREFLRKRYEEHNDRDLFTLAQTTENLHRRFLEEVTFNEFKSSNSKKIEPQPHRIGGLLYHHPSTLHSYMFAKMEPGILLQTDTSAEHRAFITPQAGYGSGHMVSFGGLRASIPVIPLGKETLYDPKEGMTTTEPRIANAVSMHDMRLMPGMVTINSLPRTVGLNASGVKGIRMRATVTTDKQLEDYYPYFPWDPRYMSDKNNVDAVGRAPSMDTFDFMEFKNGPDTSRIADYIVNHEELIEDYGPLLPDEIDEMDEDFGPAPLTPARGLPPRPPTESERAARNVNVLSMLNNLTSNSASQPQRAPQPQPLQTQRQPLDPAQHKALNAFTQLSNRVSAGLCC